MAQSYGGWSQTGHAGNTASGSGSTRPKKGKGKHKGKKPRAIGVAGRGVEVPRGGPLPALPSPATPSGYTMAPRNGGGNGGPGGNAGGGNPAPSLSPTDRALLAQGYTLPEIRAANAQAGLQYGPAIGLTKQAIQNTPGYFQDYRNTITGSQGAVNQLSDPAVSQAFVRAQGTGQTVLGPGAAPDAANNDALAAAARQALGNASAQALQGQNLADNSYFSKLGANSQLQQMGAIAALNNQLGSQRTQQANAKVTALTGLHQQNLTNALEASTLLSGNALKRYEAKLSAGTARAKIKATTSASKAKFIAQYGVGPDVYSHMTKGERLKWKKTWNKSGQSASDKLTSARLKYFRKHGVFPGTASQGGSSAAGQNDAYGNTPKQQRAADSTYTKVRAIAGQIVQPGDNWKAIYKLLVVKYPTADSTILKAAAMRVTGTHIPHGVLSGLRQQGVNTNKIHNPKKHRPAPLHRPDNAKGANGQSRPT